MKIKIPAPVAWVLGTFFRGTVIEPLRFYGNRVDRQHPTVSAAMEDRLSSELKIDVYDATMYLSLMVGGVSNGTAQIIANCVMNGAIANAEITEAGGVTEGETCPYKLALLGDGIAEDAPKTGVTHSQFFAMIHPDYELDEKTQKVLDGGLENLGIYLKAMGLVFHLVLNGKCGIRITGEGTMGAFLVKGGKRVRTPNDLLKDLMSKPGDTAIGATA